ncbi:hypothetical protein PSHT_00941 [Puccinia striiformis]|uniref:Integrase catalytic domain-containing protein n=1 Tax=Puccinia striiformis TaxID=27350 RepID=A0A2S4WLZ0_9BASI|nr:hypothetical protein PSHT_00941 [Puccinia striiformis]
MSDHRSLIPILTELNFKHWKRNIYSYCQSKNINDHLESDLVATATPEKVDDLQKEKNSAAGIMTLHMGDEYCTKFVTDENKSQPHIIWKLLDDHFLASTPQNQALVYEKFLNVTFESTLSKFINIIDSHVADMRSVGLKIGIPKPDEINVNEILLAEKIVHLLPSSLNYTKEVLYTKRPLTLAIVKSHLESKRLDGNVPVQIQSEPAMKVVGPSCKNGVHNPLATHPEEKCFQLHPDQEVKFRKRFAKKRAKAVIHQEGVDHNDTSSGTAYLCAAKNAQAQSSQILLDSCCSDHMFSDKSLFVNYAPISSRVEIADGQFMPVVGTGYVYIINTDGVSYRFKALHIPSLSQPLLSFCRLFLKNCDLIRSGTDTLNLVNSTNDLKLFSVKIVGKVLVANASALVQKGQHSGSISRSLKVQNIDSGLLHRRAGHPNGVALRKLFNIHSTTLNCEACRLSKSTRLPYLGKLPVSTHPLQYIYMDLSGKITPATIGGASYYFKITDAFSSFKYVYILKSKSDAFFQFKEFYQLVTNLHSRNVINVITDGGGEFCSNEFEAWFKEKGINHQITAPYTPQQNSVAERGNRTTSEKARALLKHANLPSTIWGEAVSTAVFYENITPMRQLKWSTPCETWFGHRFDSSCLRVSGCRAYVNIPKERRVGKFGDTAKEGILVGYQLGIPNWRVLTAGGRIEYSHDVIFDETAYPGISPSAQAGIPILSNFFEDNIPVVSPPASAPSSPEESPTPSVYHSDDESSAGVKSQLLGNADHPGAVWEDSGPNLPTGSLHGETLLPQQANTSNPKPSYHYVPASQPAPRNISSDVDPANIISTKRRAAAARHLLTATPFYDPLFAFSTIMPPQVSLSSPVPKTFSAAMASSEAEDWRRAVDIKLEAMARLNVWKMVPLPEGRSLLGSVWVFQKKFDADGNLVKFKARLCAQGSAQVEGVDYDETYAPTGRPAALRAMIAVGINEGMDIHQMDVRNAFLNGTLDEDIYLRPPSGLSVPPGHCLKLLKSIYGLKQAPRVWYCELLAFFESIDFAPSPADPCLFISAVTSWKCFVHVYVDDMAIVSDDVGRFKKLVSERFLMDDLGPARSLLGIKIDRFDTYVKLSQEKYVDGILAEYNMTTNRSVDTPMVPNTRLVASTEHERVEFRRLGINYRRAIGSINYLSVSTRPDIAFTVSQLSQHLENPGIKHWRAFLHLLRYPSGTKSAGIRVGGGKQSVLVYTDADWANCVDTRRSYSGYLVKWGNSVISWKSRKQSSISSSTTEAEYRALYEGVQEAIWLRRLFESLGYPIDGPIPIFSDNQAAIALSCNPLHQQQTKHIDLKYHWVREMVESGEVKISYIPTATMPADGLTKSLAKPRHQVLFNFINIGQST